MKVAYADPPYPGMAGLYPENNEVDHPELIAELSEYDGWALSTDERSLAYVLPLCPEGTRILAWCRPNAPPFRPNPYASWEPVLCKPARTKRCDAPSYFVAGAPTGFRQVAGLTGQKPRAFCEWVFRCLGAKRGDTLHDVFPGTGIVGKAWETFQTQPPLFVYDARSSGAKGEANKLRSLESLEGFERRNAQTERRVKVQRVDGSLLPSTPLEG